MELCSLIFLYTNYYIKYKLVYILFFLKLVKKFILDHNFFFLLLRFLILKM